MQHRHFIHLHKLVVVHIYDMPEALGPLTHEWEQVTGGMSALMSTLLQSLHRVWRSFVTVGLMLLHVAFQVLEKQLVNTP